MACEQRSVIDDNEHRSFSLMQHPANQNDVMHSHTSRAPATAPLNTNAKTPTSRRNPFALRHALLTLLSTSTTLVAAQSSGDCISLKGSTTCPSFQSASISTNGTLTSIFSFLKYVSDRSSFDSELSDYVKTSYIQEKYQSTFGCGKINFKNTDDLYARFTTTVICNAIVQNSIDACGLSEDNSRPVCADSCAEYAQSEAYVTADDNLCSNPRDELSNLIRADFTNCALPARALDSSECISAIDNEPDNCGYGDSKIGLCSYCASGGANSTDTCCYNANAEKNCKDVKLPNITATLTLPTSTDAATPSNTNAAKEDDDGGLGGGAIAGIVIGTLAGVALLGLLLFFCIRMMKRRRPSTPKGSIFNQPSPARAGPSMVKHSEAAAPQGYEVLPGGRIARMSALEGHSGNSHLHNHTPSASVGTTAAAYTPRRLRTADNQSSSDEFGESPMSENRGGILRPPPTAMKRNGSLSSGSVLGSSGPQSPGSTAGLSSPQGVTSQQSEQLPFFKDYYSQDDIHPGDRVATLWAYQPRAADEFTLERGDMLKVVGIWDDGWATGTMVNERADEWEARRQAQRDSGVSNTSGRRDSSPTASGEIKAFPLVCVCLPEHWRKTIEGDGSTESGSTGFPGQS